MLSMQDSPEFRICDLHSYTTILVNMYFLQLNIDMVEKQ